MAPRGIYVDVGQFVLKGEVIGEMGNTGSSTVRHLHFEIGTRTQEFNPKAGSQNLDFVYNPEKLSYENNTRQTRGAGRNSRPGDFNEDTGESSLKALQICPISAGGDRFTNVRNAPNGDVIGTAARNKVATVLGTEGQWYLVTLTLDSGEVISESSPGYIHGSQLNLENCRN